MVTKVCVRCGKSFDPFHPDHQYCSKCFREISSGSSPPNKTSSRKKPSKPSTSTDFEFDDQYLKDGYFLTANGEKYLNPDLVDKIAQEIAKLFVNQGLKSNQIGLFFRILRGIEKQFRPTVPFVTITPRLKEVKAKAYRQVGRDLVPDDFRFFLEKNIALAVVDKDNFKNGFMVHFEAIYCFFTFYSRD